MNPRVRQTVLWAVTLLVILVAYALMKNLYSDVNATSVFHLWALGGAFLVALLQQLLSPVFSIAALRGVEQTSNYFSMLWITLFSTSANSTVPFPAGMPIRAVLQKRILRIPYTASASAILIETVLGYGFSGIACLVTGYIWLRPVVGQQILLVTKPTLIVGIVAGTIFTLILAWLIFRRTGGRSAEYFNSVRASLSNVKAMPLIIMFGINAFIYILFTLRMTVVLYAVGVRVPVGPLFATMLFSHLAGVLSFIPMGIGVRDVSMASILVMFGVPFEFAAAAVAIDRVLITLPFLIGGVLATHVLGKDVLKLTTDEKEIDSHN